MRTLREEELEAMEMVAGGFYEEGGSYEILTNDDRSAWATLIFENGNDVAPIRELYADNKTLAYELARDFESAFGNIVETF